MEKAPLASNMVILIRVMSDHEYVSKYKTEEVTGLETTSNDVAHKPLHRIHKVPVPATCHLFDPVEFSPSLKQP